MTRHSLSLLPRTIQSKRQLLQAVASGEVSYIDLVVSTWQARMDTGGITPSGYSWRFEPCRYRHPGRRRQ